MMDIDSYIMPRKCTDHHHSKQFFYHQRQSLKCCYCKYPVIVRHSRQLEHTTVEELCDKILSCNIRLNKRHLQTRSAKSVSDLCANIVTRGIVQAANRECLCTTTYSSKTIGIDSSLSSVELRSIIFPRKCFSLPHCYKPHLNLNCGCAQDEKCTPKWEIRETNKTVTSESEINHVNSQKRINPSEFKMKLDVMKKWFGEFNDEQKNIMLKTLMNQCGASQNHMLSVTMAPIMHQFCPPNCEDLLSWLPQNLALYILSFLDTVSLSMSAMVCKSWNVLASEPCLWQRFCRQPQWQLSRAAEQKQMINYRLPNGGVDWKQAFAERYRLQRNWLKGYCHVRTFHGHTQGVFCVQFDDTRIVSGSSDKTIKVWNIRTNSPWSVMTLVGHSGTVRCLHLEGNRLVSGSSDCTIKVKLYSVYLISL
ncbi:uncharacterized protein [Centruroides vittatus]|uniref:uncharacterized protein n=1 Tax=Centruroides vittatus TaxID=120091 RepID=UPI00350FAF5A